MLDHLIAEALAQREKQLHQERAKKEQQREETRQHYLQMLRTHLHNDLPLLTNLGTIDTKPNSEYEAAFFLAYKGKTVLLQTYEQRGARFWSVTVGTVQREILTGSTMQHLVLCAIADLVD